MEGVAPLNITVPLPAAKPAPLLLIQLPFTVKVLEPVNPSVAPD